MTILFPKLAFQALAYCIPPIILLSPDYSPVEHPYASAILVLAALSAALGFSMIYPTYRSPDTLILYEHLIYTVQVFRLLAIGEIIPIPFLTPGTASFYIAHSLLYPLIYGLFNSIFLEFTRTLGDDPELGYFQTFQEVVYVWLGRGLFTALGLFPWVLTTAGAVIRALCQVISQPTGFEHEANIVNQRHWHWPRRNKCRPLYSAWLRVSPYPKYEGERVKAYA